MRVKASQELLQNTDLNVTQICMQTGFSSLSYYGRVFKQLVGKSTSEYRKAALRMKA
jgi:transcriptional regulator GlxA family with amidase domain